MKHFSIFSFLAAFLLCFSCTTEQVEPNLTKPDPTPEHHVAVETALADLNALLIDLDGGGTRSGGTRTVANVATVRTSELGMATRSADPSVEELVYIANFENNAGYAILGADDRLESVIAITEQGNLTSTQFAAAARGEYDHVAEPPVLPEVATYALGLGGNIGGGGIGGGIGGDPGSGNIPIVDKPIGGIPIPTTSTNYLPWETTIKVGPYCQMKWGQDYPYNQFTPVHVGKHCPVGCVAVALGQIIATNAYNTYKKTSNFPSKSTIGNYTVKWNSMFSEIDRYIQYPAGRRFYTKYENSDIIKNIAYFLRGIGEEANMDYGKDASGTNINQASHVLRYMGYVGVESYNYTTERVHAIVVTNKLPIYVKGDAGSHGHAWVIDGEWTQQCKIETYLVNKILIRTDIRTRTFFHCNYGWTGRADGYYLSHVFDVGHGAFKPETGMGDVPDSLPRNYNENNRIILYNL